MPMIEGVDVDVVVTAEAGIGEEEHTIFDLNEAGDLTLNLSSPQTNATTAEVNTQFKGTAVVATLDPGEAVTYTISSVGGTVTATAETEVQITANGQTIVLTPVSPQKALPAGNIDTFKPGLWEPGRWE